ncbi:unnamed protein product [Parnassius mnemosyne]|uniref:PiggyBac transposable element-derived protein domain-containing protein n=1 Tax=Parnassius mnemosyne TaxID=213953 RepID=A0AAV1L5E1_9NEOP
MDDDNKAGPSEYSVPKWRNKRLTSAELRAALDDSESEEEPYTASDEDEYVPELEAMDSEESDSEKNPVVEEEEYYDSDDEDEEESPIESNLLSKDGTQWYRDAFPQAQTVRRNILRQKPGAANYTASYSAKEIFKIIISTEMCDIILRETNRKAQKVTNDYNRKIMAKNRRFQKNFQSFTEIEFDAFLGILLAAGVHRSNKEHISEMWKLESLPLIRAAMSRDRYKMFLRFIRFDNESTRNERAKTDKAAPIRDMWMMVMKI